MKEFLLKIEDLSVYYKSRNHKVKAAYNVNFSIKSGESIGLIGESGSGKTSIAMAIMGLLKESVEVLGDVWYKDINLNSLQEKEKNNYRWNKIAIVFQNSMDVLNPVLTIYEQIYECIKRHTTLSKKEIEDKVGNLFKAVGLSIKWASYYPHQISGGMRQRVLIAMALSCDPEVLIIDEPTTALDAASKSEIIELLLKLHKEKKFAMVVISHEMQVIAKLTSRLAVLYKGHILEEGITIDVLKNPRHPYTRGLINSSPTLNPYRDLWGIPGEIKQSSNNECPFYDRCNQRIDMCKNTIPQLNYISIERKVACNRGGIVTLLEGININKTYSFKGEKVKACNECSIKIYAGETVVLIGESGSGKTTLASILCGLLESDEGNKDKVLFKGEKVIGNNVTSIENGMQMVFQDPFSATNEHFTVEQVIREPLDIIKVYTKEERKQKVIEMLKEVQLPFDKEFMERRCYELSGGQRQRVAIARSLIMEPKVLIADEISAMLDASTQANIVRLLKGLQNTKGFSMLYITHDLALAQKIADKVYVMYRGNIIEKGLPSDIFSNPKASYTKHLVDKGLNVTI